jgi:hypothetical protein
MSYTLQNPLAYFPLPTKSSAAGLCKLYVGLIDTDPLTPANQVQVYAVQQDGSEFAIPQPIQLSAGGVPQYNGSPVQLKFAVDTVSMKVVTAIGALVSYTPRWSAEVNTAALGAVDSSVSVGGVTASNLARKYGEFKSVKDFGAVGGGITNDTAAIKAAIASFSTFGGTLHFPAGQYRVTETIYLKTGVSLSGDGYYGSSSPFGTGVSAIIGDHNSAAVLSLKGVIGSTVSQISLYGGVTANNTKPKTGLILGRGAVLTEQCAFNTIENVSVVGNFSVAPVYHIAAELNNYRNMVIWDYSGTSRYPFFTSTIDLFNIDSMAASTNIGNSLSNCHMFNSCPDIQSACIFMECGREMGNWSFNDCYLTPFAGVYVRVSMGGIDGQAPFGPIKFSGTSGEWLTGGNPKIGFDITSTVPVLLSGLTIEGGRLQVPSNPTQDVYDIKVGDNITLLNPFIVIQPPEAFAYAFSKVDPNKVRGGVVIVGRRYEWVEPALLNGFVNGVSLPYPNISYQVSPTGEVSLRGVAAAGTGEIFTLPPELRPSVSLLFSTTSASGNCRILVNSLGGVVLLSGSNDGVDLSPVRFRP